MPQFLYLLILLFCTIKIKHDTRQFYSENDFHSSVKITDEHFPCPAMHPNFRFFALVRNYSGIGLAYRTKEWNELWTSFDGLLSKIGEILTVLRIKLAEVMWSCRFQPMISKILMLARNRMRIIFGEYFGKLRSLRERIN